MGFESAPCSIDCTARSSSCCSSHPSRRKACPTDQLTTRTVRYLVSSPSPSQRRTTLLTSGGGCPHFFLRLEQTLWLTVPPLSRKKLKSFVSTGLVPASRSARGIRQFAQRVTRYLGNSLAGLSLTTGLWMSHTASAWDLEFLMLFIHQPDGKPLTRPLGLRRDQPAPWYCVSKFS